jgi:hypothetical protein
MNDIEKSDKNIPSRSSLSKLGITAVGYTAAGIFLILLQGFAKIRGLGLIVGGVVCVLGIASFTSKDPADRKAGAIITAAGVLTLLSKIPVAAPVAATLLTIGAVGLLALGIINGVKFLIGLKKRS